MASIINATTTNGVAVQGDNSGSLQLQTNNGTTAVTVTTAQLVGVGTTTPSAKLHVSQVGNPVAQFTRSDSGTGLIIASDSDGPYFRPETSSAIRFNNSANTVENMRITSGGDLLVGTTTSSGKFTVNQTDTGTRTISASSPASYAATVFRSDSAATSGTGWYHLYGSSSSGTVNNIFIYGNGNIQNANNSYGAISDIKLKENIVDATPKLDKLMQVKVRNYNLKGEYEQHKQIGVIAQELETVFPSLIEETQDRGENDELLGTTTKSVKYSVFVPILIKAIQELKEELDATKAEVQALKGVA